METIMDDGKYFIHFSTIEECNTFKSGFNGSIGHTCCGGLGVHIKTYNGKDIDNEEIYENIRKEYNTFS